MTTYRSDNGMDKRLEEMFGDFVGHACDVGANDGVQLSNSLVLEEKGWTVLCVEPNPMLEAEGRKARKLWRSVAAGDVDRDGREFYLCSPGNKWASTSSLGTRGGHAEVDQIVFVDVRRLDRLLEESGFPKLDLLTVDVEGWEKEVMSGFTVERWKPRIIVLEAWDSTYDIAIPGYDIIEKLQYDNLYVRQGS